MNQLPGGKDRLKRWHGTKANLTLGCSKGKHFLSLQQTPLCVPQGTPKPVQSPHSLQVSIRSLIPHRVTPAELCNRRGLAPLTWYTNWKIHKNFKRSQAQPSSPQQRRAAEIWKTGLLTPPGTRVAMDTTSPAWRFFCPFVLKLLCYSALTHAGKERIFLPTSPKPVFRVQKAFEDSELGELILFHVIFSIIDFFQTPCASR